MSQNMMKMIMVLITKIKFIFQQVLVKKKIAGKDSFVVKLNNLPTDEEIENHSFGGKKNLY